MRLRVSLFALISAFSFQLFSFSAAAVPLTPQQSAAVDYLDTLLVNSGYEARSTFTSGAMSGKPFLAPGPAYPNCYIRDMEIALEARPELLTAPELLDLINRFFATHGGSGQIYDALSPDSAAFTSVTSNPFPAYDNIYYLIELCYIHYQQTGLTTAYTTNQTALGNALNYVPIDTHLVKIADNATLSLVHVGWGFQDQIASSGYELPTSVLRYRALGHLAELCAAAGQTTNAGTYRSEVAAIPAALKSKLWDAAAGWYYNASTKNHVHSVVGSAMAVAFGAALPDCAAKIKTNLVSGRPGHTNDLAGKGFYDNGAIRHTPLDEAWTSLRYTRDDDFATNDFQDGSYWPAFIGFVVKSLQDANGLSTEGDKIISEYVAWLRTQSATVIPFEYENTADSDDSFAGLGTANYLASAAAPIAIFRGRLDPYHRTVINPANGASLGVQRSRVSTQFDKATSTTLGNVTGLTANVLTGKTYSFRAVLHVSLNATGGGKVALAGVTATAIRAYAFSPNEADITLGTRGGVTAIGSAITFPDAGNKLIIVEGFITPSANGALTVQFAENSSSGTSSVLVGSTLAVTEIP